MSATDVLREIAEYAAFFDKQGITADVNIPPEVLSGHANTQVLNTNSSSISRSGSSMLGSINAMLKSTW